MAGAARHDNPQPPVRFNVAIAEIGSSFYGNRQSIPRSQEGLNTL